MSRAGLGEHARRLRRRAVSIPLLLVSWLGVTVSIVLALPALALLDLARPLKPWARTRALLSVYWILSCEVVGVAILGLLWLGFLVHRDQQRFSLHNTLVQREWTNALFAGCRRIYRLTIVSEGLEDTVARPTLFFVRHVSVVDTVLAAACFANRQEVRLRYVLKDELLYDPCLDIVGNRLPNVFVTRGADSAGDVARVGALAHGLARDEGVLIYPEGTRFSPAKLERAKARLASDPAIASKVAALRCLLPPRSGGSLALLQAAPEADLVLLAHSGLESAASLRDFWRGELVGRELRVQARRIPAAAIPPEARQSISWLMDRWLEMDAWLAEPGMSQEPMPAVSQNSP